MSNDQQSSIDFLLKELEEIGVLNIKNCHWSDEVDIKKAIEQAKAMHKEEVINAHTIGYVIGGGNGYIHEPEQYYNETYIGNKQECQFEIDNSTSSATKCKFCGKEKWQH